MGEMERSCCGDLTSEEESVCELPAEGIIGRCFDHDRDFGGCEAQVISEAASAALDGSADASDQPSDQFQCNAVSVEGAEGLCFPPPDDNVASVVFENGSGLYASGRSEAEDSCALEAQEEGRRCNVPEPSPTVGTANVGSGERGSDFPRLLPLGTQGGDGSGCSSGTGIGEEGVVVAGFFEGDQDGKDCKVPMIRPSGMVTSSFLVNGTMEQADGVLCHSPPRDNTVVSINFETNLSDKRLGELVVSEPEPRICRTDGASVPCLIGSNTEENQLLSAEITERLCIDNLGVQPEQKEADACTPLEERDTVFEGGFGEKRCRASLIEGEFCSLVQGLPDTESPCWTGEETASHQSSHLHNVSEGYPLNLPSVPEGTGDVNVASVSPSCYSSAADSCVQANNDGRADLKSGSITVIRRANPKRAASSRNISYSEVSIMQPGTRSTVKQRRHAVNVSALSPSSTFGIFSCTAKRKRSCPFKPARASVWGANLFEDFWVIDVAMKHGIVFSQCKTKKSNKARCGGGRRRCPTARKGSVSRGSRAKCAASINPLPLEEEKDQPPTFPPVIDLSALVPTYPNGCLLNSDLQTDFGISKIVGEGEHMLKADGCSAGQLSCQYEKVESPVMSLEQDAQHGDKELESSVTQETSFENTLGECPGVSSQVGPEVLVEAVNERLLLDPGTSPDSDVLHPGTDVGHLTSESATFTSGEPLSDAGIMGQKGSISEYGTQEHLPADALPISEVPKSVLPEVMWQYTRTKKGIKDGKVIGKKNVNDFLENKSHGLASLDKPVKPVRRSRPKQEERDGSDLRKHTNRKHTGKTSRKALKFNGFPGEQSELEMTNPVCCQGKLEAESHLHNRALSGEGVGTSQLESRLVGSLSLGTDVKGHKLLKAGVSKGRSIVPDSARHRRRNSDCQKKDKMHKSINKRKAKERELPGQVIFEKESSLEEQGDLSCLPSLVGRNSTFSGPDESNRISKPGSGIFEEISGPNSGNEVAPENTQSFMMEFVSDELAIQKSDYGMEGQCLPLQIAWVRCDDCYKWRCISAALADIIDETNCKWTCKENSDRAFADCSIPQEKTNTEINAELELSDVSCDEEPCTQPNSKGSGHTKLAASQPATWNRIKCNMFLHRSHKTQTIDEIMVCQCKPPRDGSLGCGDGCLNRILNIECVKGTCPCGDLCSNRRFQKRKYVKFKPFRYGKKGYGLQLLEDVSRGQFLIEYVGEVLDLASYEARQRDYASRGQKHFYFMTLNYNEVIDACAKGNLGRFINHSCEPNCRTEKWNVKGEVSIGLFAMRDIKKGEEVTFDYNYVRVFGAAAKKCVCGSAECRGYIGSDPLNTEAIVQGDSDEEYPEPVMICEDGESELDIDEVIPDSTDDVAVQREEISLRNLDTRSKLPAVAPEVVAPLSTADSIHRSSPDVQPLEIFPRILNSISRTTSGSVVDGNRPMPETIGDKPHGSKLNPPIKSYRSSGSIKKSRCRDNKSVTQKGKKPIAICRPSRFEGVEEKLNEFLDADGGISKRRDGAKGYLKLLFLTAASGDNAKSETAQSTRDLSLILDALLKTKSRIVLIDIINKNGLQMLHNIMKQNRGNFSKIPIIRKLLKVLEFLAVKEILTPEHINSIPSHAGVESFKESIIKLTYHNDVQVHQIARSFRDKWLPRTIRRANLSDRDSGWSNVKCVTSNWFPPSPFKRHPNYGARDTDAIDCVSQTIHPPSSMVEMDSTSEITSLHGQQGINSVPSTDIMPTVGTKKRKRKSRWDQPSDSENLDPELPSCTKDVTVQANSKFAKLALTQTELNSDHEVMNVMSDSKREVNNLDYGAGTIGVLRQQDIDETPPGFGSSLSSNQPQVHSDNSVFSAEVVVGHPQERYLSQLTVSYGIPLALAQKLGTTDAEAGETRCHPSWTIAPGIPFHPFPPLPPFPRGEVSPITNHGTDVQGTREEAQPTERHPTACQSDSSIPSVSGERPPEVAETGAINPQPAGRMSQSSDGFGRGFPRHQRWNGRGYQKWGPRWSQERNCNRSKGNMRNGMSNVGLGNIRKVVGGGFSFPEGIGGEDVGSTSCEQTHQDKVQQVIS